MTLEAIAKAYVNCVDLEEKARSQASELAEELSILRADLHALLMDALRQAQIPFTDRASAAHLAYDISRGKLPVH